MTQTLVVERNGKRFNPPNDVEVSSERSIWLSDPVEGIEVPRGGHRVGASTAGATSFVSTPITGGARGHHRLEGPKRACVLGG